MVKAPSLLLNRGGALKDGSSSHTTLPSQIASSSSSMSAYYKKKYKPWRKGKSTKHNGGDTTGGITSAKSHGSLKQQLRGLQRLQQKKMKDRTSIEGTLADEQQLQQQEQELQEKIDALQEQIQMRTISEKERINAKKSHKLRFVDRQRTTRLYQQYIKQLQQLEEQLHQITSTDSNDTTVDMQRQQRNKINDDLYRLALDQIYIAHFPLDRTSYVSLFNPTNHNHAVISSTSSSNATQMPTQQQQRRTVMNNRLLHKMATQRQCIIERLNKTHQIINETKHQNQIIEEEDDDTHHEANQRTNNNNKIPSDKTICSSTTKRIQPVSWIHPSQYERIQHLSTWSTQLERTTFQITIVNDNSTSDNGKSKSSHDDDDDDDDDMVQSSSEVDISTDNRTDERFHNVTATFNTTQQLLLQEQERMERELSTLEDDEEENKDDEVAEQSQLITTKGTKHRTANTTRVASTYDNDDSDASGDSSNSNDDEMDDDDDNNVDPLQRSVGAVVAKVSREHDEITGDIEDEDDDSDSSSSEQSSDSVSVSSQPDNTSNTINYNDTENSQMATSQDEVIAMATNLRKLASQKGKVSTNNNHKSVEMEEEDDFFVSLDDDNDKDHELHPTSKNVNVFANAKRDTIRYNHSHNGTGDKSQGWVTQKQLPGQFRKKQRR